MSLLDTLVQVNISIGTAVPDSASFGNILIVGPAPATAPETAPPAVGKYTELSEVKDAGWGTDDPVYKGASVAFANGASPLYIAVQQTTSGTTLEGVDKTLDRALETDDWYGIAPCGTAAGDLTKIAEWADANNKLFGFTVSGSTNPVGTSHPYAFGFATKSAATYPNNLYTHVAMLAIGFGYTPGSETWAYKTLAGIEPEPYTATEMSTLESAALNYYTVCAGKSITLSGKTVSGEWIDVIRFRDWLKNDMQKRIYNLLIANPKVPFTSGGITLIQNQMLASLTQGQRQGGIAPTEYDDDGNATPGFTTSVPDIGSVSDAERAARNLKGCKFTARLAGAIHLVEVSGSLVS